ncbi:MAG TPA: cytochrome c biogenesis protein CcsA [Phycisphaerae bacterium]|nr:cytochrome c biogenesis protein CcsA [Phycisphaerae bacterium]
MSTHTKPSLPRLRRRISGSQQRVLASIVIALLAILLAVPLRAVQIDQAKPGENRAANPHAGMGMTPEAPDDALVKFFAAQKRDPFEKAIQLDEFRLLAVQHLDQIKILDSWARQTMRTITRHESLDGKDPLYCALDMAFRKEAYFDKNIIYVESVPIRDALGAFTDGIEGRRIHDKGTVSYNFLSRPEVAAQLKQISLNSAQLQSVNKLQNAFDTFRFLGNSLTMVPPAADQRQSPWVHPMAIAAALQVAASRAAEAPRIPLRAGSDPEPMPWHYSAEQQSRIASAFLKLGDGWQSNDVVMANQGLAELTAIAPAIDPEGYPSAARRNVELWYNRTFSGTLVAFVYFAAMVLFFLSAIGITKAGGGTYRTGLSIYAIALFFHIAAMGVRWWISGRIPIQNQFESVLGSACIGCLVGFGLELWKKNGIFGAAFSFVGFLAATALLASPYVFGTNLGADPGKVSGVLANTFWLYIHVNIVISSYALILASAAIALIYLGLKQWHWINPIEPGFSDGGGTGSPSKGGGSGRSTAVATATDAVIQINHQRTAILETLDQANMVILQMAFWALGVGIMCGAVWADQSWGRPWGWDPKETFALVTWIVYLIIVHVRMVIKSKADTTAWLSLGGCATMLFNWIGVNFFLVGLHSYAS